MSEARTLTVKFLGRILPPAAILNTTDLPKTNWAAPDLGLSMTFGTQIKNSVVSVDCNINNWNKKERSHRFDCYNGAAVFPHLNLTRGVMLTNLSFALAATPFQSVFLHWLLSSFARIQTPVNSDDSLAPGRGA